jgi:hypothetical protein
MVLLYGFAFWFCFMVLLYGFALWFCFMMLYVGGFTCGRHMPLLHVQ